MRDPGDSGLGTASATCPWGCLRGPGGWSGVPFCPRHCPPGARDAFGHGPGLWYCPSEEEEEEEEWWWMRFRHHWDVPSKDSDPPYNFGEVKKSPCPEPPPARAPPSALEVKLQRLPPPWALQPTAEEAERNARELVAEEERVKRKAEKKKLKKKKQKDRKKREKLGDELKSKQEAESNTPSLSSTVGAEHPQNSTAEDGEGWPGPSPSPCPAGSAASGEEGEGRGPTAEETEEELDLSCPFLCKARQKAGVRLPAPGREKPARTGSAEPGKKAAEKAPQPEPVPLDLSAVEQSRILTGRGIEAAQGGYYAEAVRVFTRAMRLNPREHRLFGNRSYCYEKLGRYEEALRDAQASLRLQPGWPKGLFRQGKALRGLQRYAEAASLFEELLRQDSDAAVATQLEACRALLRQSSPSHRSSPRGVPMSPSLLEAREPPLLPPGEWASGNCRDMGTSGGVTVVSPRGQARGTGRAAATSPQALPPTHPARDCYPLWVGNVTPRISEKVLLSSFGRFGEIRFIRVLPAQRCAFVNYRHKAAAEAAYGAMQDAEVEGSRLVLQLKHPSHATPAPRRHPEPPGIVGAPHRGPL